MPISSTTKSPLLLQSPASHPTTPPHLLTTDKRLEDWSVVRLWFAGRHFDTPEALAQAWKDDNKGLRSNFYWEAPGVCICEGGGCLHVCV